MIISKCLKCKEKKEYPHLNEIPLKIDEYGNVTKEYRCLHCKGRAYDLVYYGNQNSNTKEGKNNNMAKKEKEVKAEKTVEKKSSTGLRESRKELAKKVVDFLKNDLKVEDKELTAVLSNAYHIVKK